MKPALNQESPVQYLRTVGPVRARALARLGVETAGDLIRLYPRHHFDRTRVEPIGRAPVGAEATVAGEVLTSGERRTRRGGRVQTVTVGDQSGVIFCVWFNQSYVLKQFRSGQKVMLSGVVQRHQNRRQMAHPDYEILDGDQDPLHTGRLVPVYPLTAGIGQHWLRRLVHQTVHDLLPQLHEWLPPDLRRRRQLVTLDAALRGIHFPADHQEHDRARRRLVYDELLAVQLVMALRRGERVEQEAIALSRPGDLTRRLVAELPFELTAAQRRVLAEILADLRRGRTMHRLLQGDVGAGKTLVAFIAALFVIEQGYQALLMAPTEVLARQHGRGLRELAEPLHVTVETLTGSVPAAERRRIVRAAGQGEIDLLVGTHAVIQDQVQLPRLALAVVDEQHRFGVKQRGRTAVLADSPAHLLVMSATPIPRSLALTLYGDLDLSLLDERPAGRQPVETEVVAAHHEERIYASCRDRIAAGAQGFVIYPVVEETEGQDIKAATQEAAALAAGPFRDQRVGLVHGRLKPREKDDVMTRFAAGEIDVLVATTVVEVGIDVARAGWLVIHHPERFGLAQLHQLRGRVGRAGQRSWCWLLAGADLPTATGERLRFFAANHDGFALAEEDLRRRGPGDLWGTRQHGEPGFRLANPLRDGQIAAETAADVETLLAGDPNLAASENASLRRALAADYGDLLPLPAG